MTQEQIEAAANSYRIAQPGYRSSAWKRLNRLVTQDLEETVEEKRKLRLKQLGAQ